ncbi:hypothetical protein B296_00051974 [Ensete ventricosum]|uniref:J domain-containing protein n=1 Tax=Ensete ventricosum TaxID=4639 RepID=A0A426YE61_ENSVE|nr:hypothetical protein B296_00051974 [Ensete ventricosum]
MRSQSWRDEVEQNSSTHETPWFRRHYWAKEAKKNGSRDPQWECNSNKSKEILSHQKFVAVIANRYRTCALKWHPDRHQGSSKVKTWRCFYL